MKKIIKRTVVGLLVILLGLILILVPSSIQSSDQLKNVEAQLVYLVWLNLDLRMQP